MKLTAHNRKLPAPIRNTITGTAIIEVPRKHAFLVPCPGADPAPVSHMLVTTITVFPPHSPLANTAHGMPVFMVAGTYSSETAAEEFFDNPVRFTDISLIPRARQELRALLQQILQEMQQTAATTGQPSPAAPAEGEGGQLIPVDFTAPRDRTSSKRAVRT